MKLTTSSTLYVISLGVLLILGSQLQVAAQSRTPELDEWRIREALKDKQRFYDASSTATTVSYDPGVPRNAKEREKYQGIARKLKTVPGELVQEFYDKLPWFPLRRVVVPLTFNKFLVAKVIASDLEATHPDITSDALLLGLSNRKSYARTMRNLGLSPEEAKAVEKKANQEIKESKH